MAAHVKKKGIHILEVDKNCSLQCAVLLNYLRRENHHNSSKILPKICPFPFLKSIIWTF
jgi:hypothetical protein